MKGFGNRAGNKDSLLKVTSLNAGYGASQVLFDFDFQIGVGEVVTLLGRNGMGKTTAIKCITGDLKPLSGSILFDHIEIGSMASHRIGRLGVGLVPEGRRIFSNLTVYENLVAASRKGPNGHINWDLDKVYKLFPRLEERGTQMANQMSGGEQQMLAIGRALMTNPRLLILDEATEGLAPLIRLEIWRCLESLRDQGQSMLVVDKNLKPLLSLADRHYVIEKGQMVWVGNSAELVENQDEVKNFLGV